MKKIFELLIGTNNKGKLKEIKALLPKHIKIYSTLDFKIKSPIENGKSFDDNSILKSKYFSKKTSLPCLADDSGLEIDILDKAPGIYSARWGGKNSDFKKAIKKVYRELNKKDKNWKTSLLELMQKWKIKEDDLKKRKRMLLNMGALHLQEKL